MFSYNENFDNNIFNKLTEMEQQHPSIQKKNFFDSIDKSLKLGKEDQQGELIFDDNEKLLNVYINNLINEGKGNPNKILADNKEELPTAPYNNYSKYNHEMRLLINSKKIKQDYIIKILKGKLNILKNSFKNINEIKNNYDLEKITH